MSDLATSEFGLHLREMAAKGRWIVGASLFVGALMFGRSSAAPQSYNVNAIVRVSLAERVGDDGGVTGFQARSLSTLVGSDQLAQQVSESVGVPADEVRDALDVEILDDPGLMSLWATASTGTQAAEIANAAAAALSASAELDPGAQAEGATVSVINAADAADAAPAVTTKGSLTTGIGAGLLTAILLGEGFVAWRILRGRFSPVGPAAELHELIGAPTLDIRASGGAEDLFAFYIQHLRSRPVLTVVDTTDQRSAELARRLATHAGGAHRQALLVDGDVGQPTLGAAAGVPGGGLGAVDAIEGRQPLSSVLRPSPESPRVLVLPVGQQRPGGLSGLQLLDAMRDLIRDSGAEQVVVSATRASSQHEMLLVAWAFPAAVVLVVDPSQITARQMRRLLDRLHEVEATVVAVLVTGRPDRVGARPRPNVLAALGRR